MPYFLYHHYFWENRKKEGKVLIAIKDTLPQAEALLAALYQNRLMPGRDYARIYDEHGTQIVSWEVDYMAQFEAVPGMTISTPSSSNPKKSYITQLNTTGIVSCGCRAWTMGWKKMNHPGSLEPYRHCTHTDELIRRFNLNVEVKGQYLMQIDPKVAAAKKKFAAKPAQKPTGPQEKFALLVQEYEEAINIMAALEPDQMYQAAAAVEAAKFKVESYLLLLEQHGIDGTPQFLAAEAKLAAVRQ